MRPRLLAFGNAYKHEDLQCLRSPEEYIDALGDELKALKGIPIREVLATDPPRKFTQLWNDLYQRYVGAA